MKKSFPSSILFLAILLILEPFIRVTSFKFSTGMEWGIVWDNIQNNGQNSWMLIEFWLLSPIAGIFLITLSRLAYVFYSCLTIYKLYAIMTYIPFQWPYFSERPHWSSVALLTLNLILMLKIFWPFVQRYFLSRHFRHIWDARGRRDVELEAQIFINSHGNSLLGEVVNISPGGARFETQSKNFISLHAEGLLVLKDPQNHHYALPVKVMNHQDKDTFQGYGIEFIDLSFEQRMQIMGLLSKIDSWAAGIKLTTQEEN
jgi:hypothetical protein